MEDMDEVYLDLMAYFDRAEAARGAFESNRAAYQWVIDRLNQQQLHAGAGLRQRLETALATDAARLGFHGSDF